MLKEPFHDVANAGMELRKQYNLVRDNEILELELNATQRQNVILRNQLALLQGALYHTQVELNIARKNGEELGLKYLATLDLWLKATRDGDEARRIILKAGRDALDNVHKKIMVLGVLSIFPALLAGGVSLYCLLNPKASLV